MMTRYIIPAEIQRTIFEEVDRWREENTIKASRIRGFPAHLVVIFTKQVNNFYQNLS